jgi:hypothetical protein
MLVLMGGVLSAVWNAGAAGPAFRPVQDSKGQVAISVPDGWTVQSPSGNATLSAASPTKAGGLPDSVDVVVHTAPPGMTAESCINEAEWITRTLGHIAFNTVEQGATTVGGFPAYSHVYTWKAPTGQDRWSSQVCIAHLGQVYVLTGTTANSSETLSEHTPVLAQIIKSVQIKQAAKAPSPAVQSTPSQAH